MTSEQAGDTEIPGYLLWIKDAPLFIDSPNLERLYDAVVRPAYSETAERTIKVSKAVMQELEASASGEAGISIPKLVSFLVSGGAKVSGSATKERTEGAEDETTITLGTISTPERRLEQLTVFYLLEQDHRLLAGDLRAPLEWQAGGLANLTPRALTFLDLSAGACFIPMAAEFANGRFVTFYDQLLAESGERPPLFTEGTKRDYWIWHATHYSVSRSVRVIEQASSNHGRMEWIDYRVPLNDDGETMHLHIEAGTAYSSGTFAYRLIERARGHGVRLVGTLKDGPSLNVLAIYER